MSNTERAPSMLLSVQSNHTSSRRHDDPPKVSDQAVAPPPDPEINFEVPNWAGRPPDGMHLDVMKGDKLVQKLMIDEKRCYYFGRMPKLCDFTIDHSSCSRVHAVLVYHTKMNRFFLVDLGSSHGTFIGTTRIEAQLATNIPVDARIHFGASTRMYTLRARPAAATGLGDETWGTTMGDASMTRLGTGYLGKAVQLPEKEEELASLTEYNTALNRRLAGVNIPDEPTKVNKHNYNVSFMDEDQVINPEDIDPSVGRFRNLVSTVVIPSKVTQCPLKREAGGNELSQFFSEHSSLPAHPAHPGTGHHSALVARTASTSSTTPTTPTAPKSPFGLVSSKIGLSLPNPAPDVDLYPAELPVPVLITHKQQLQLQNQPRHALKRKDVHDEYEPDVMEQTAAGTIERLSANHMDVSEHEPRRKKYAKEAWPGKKPSHLLLA